MSELFAVFKQHLAWALMLWVAFFTVFAALFAPRQLTAFVVGVVRVLAGIVVSPFVFIRRAVHSVLSFTATEEENYRASDQYLLNKAMLILQALVIVVAIGLLSAGLVAVWNVWVPSSEVRRTARDYAKTVEEQRKTTAAAVAAVAKLDTEWTQKADVVIGNFRRERQARKASAQKSLTATEEVFASYGSENGRAKLAEMQRYAARVDMTFERTRQAKYELDSMSWTWGLASWEPQSLRAWNDHWYRKVFAEVELANIPTDALRTEAQPTYAEVKAVGEREPAVLASMEEHSKQLDEAASLKWKAATWTALGAFVTFILFVWLWGALIEIGWLAIRIADDVRRMRKATVDPLIDVTQPAARIPARGSGMLNGALLPPTGA
jgi:hypothetical protein